MAKTKSGSNFDLLGPNLPTNFFFFFFQILIDFSSHSMARDPFFVFQGIEILIYSNNI